MTLSQDNRLLKINTPLGKNAFILTHFSGYEAISEPYHYHLSLLSNNAAIKEKQILGKAVSFQVVTLDEVVTFHGIVYTFAIGTMNPQGLRRYQMTLVPWFQSLDLKRDCRIYQQCSIPDIFKSQCQQIGFYDFDLSGLSKSYQALDYCVQYNETSFHFLSRLLQQVGIYYYFKQEANKHILMLTDHLGGCPLAKAKVIYNNYNQDEEHLSQFLRNRQLQSLKQTGVSYDFLQPTLSYYQSLETPLQQAVNADPSQYEVYYYPQAFTKQRATANAWQWEIFKGVGNYTSFNAGTRFKLTQDDNKNLHREYLITSLIHDAYDSTHLTEEKNNSAKDKPKQFYQNSFICFDDLKNKYAPPLSLKKPTIPSVQTATVVGPKGQAIYTDKYGRIKIHFHWDRYHKQDKEASCWIRAGQDSADTGFGNQFIPRIGQEVMVHFIAGDVDFPMITSAVANANNMPAFSLPNNENKSWIKTHTLNSKDENAFNAIVLDDTPNAEKFQLQAQKDLNQDIKHDYRYKVDGTETVIIGGNETTQVLTEGVTYTAKEIHLSGGGSEIIINDAGVTMKGSAAAGGKVNILTKGAGPIKPIARVGDKHQCPQHKAGIPHKGGPILKGANFAKANSMAIARVGDPAHCRTGKDKIKQGICSFTINNKAVARVGHKFSHGGVITTGSPNVFVGEKPNDNS